ncbi:hypothetical protein S83_057979, partial [Arachis hypogaea]
MESQCYAMPKSHSSSSLPQASSSNIPAIPGWKCSSSCFSKSIFIEYGLNQNEEARTELRAVDAWILTDKPYSNQSIHSELLNLEKISKSDLSKVSSLIKKQTKRFQVLSEKIDDLCRRIQGSDPSEPPLSSEFRAQTQTEFLLE